MSEAEKIIKPGDMEKIQQVFPGKFILVYVVDREKQVGDIGASVQTAADAKMARTLIHRLTLGDNGKRGNN